MRKASLGTLFLTVFLDLLAFGLVVPFLPRVARAYGAPDVVATLTGTAFSLMQFLFVPLWGRLSDRIGRRPVLLWSVAASAIGQILLALSWNLPSLFFARLWSGAATANIAVAQAYIADITTPEDRSRGMGLIGVAFGLGFIFGPFLGGELGRFVILGRVGAAPALAAALLCVVNFFLALRYLPESLPPAARGQSQRSASPISPAVFRRAFQLPGVAAAVLVSALVSLSFAGMEQIFALYTSDTFRWTMSQTGRVLGFVGLVAAVVQGTAIRRLTRVFSEIRLIRIGVLLTAAGFALTGLVPAAAPWGPMLFASGLVALGSSLTNPSVSSYVSQRSDAASQGATLGVLQSIGALGRVFGPALAGALYQTIGPRLTYHVLAAQMLLAAGATVALPAPVAKPLVLEPQVNSNEEQT
jgi:MFS family permease